MYVQKNYYRNFKFGSVAISIGVDKVSLYRVS